MRSRRVQFVRSMTTQFKLNIFTVKLDGYRWGHLGEPHHIASLCAYLISDGGGFVSGQMIACNGAAET